MQRKLTFDARYDALLSLEKYDIDTDKSAPAVEFPATASWGGGGVSCVSMCSWFNVHLIHSFTEGWKKGASFSTFVSFVAPPMALGDTCHRRSLMQLDCFQRLAVQYQRQANLKFKIDKSGRCRDKDWLCTERGWKMHKRHCYRRDEGVAANDGTQYTQKINDSEVKFCGELMQTHRTEWRSAQKSGCESQKKSNNTKKFEENTAHTHARRAWPHFNRARDNEHDNGDSGKYRITLNGTRAPQQPAFTTNEEKKKMEELTQRTNIILCSDWGSLFSWSFRHTYLGRGMSFVTMVWRIFMRFFCRSG